MLFVLIAAAYQFAYFSDLVDPKNVDQKIAVRKEEIQLQKEHWRSKISREEIHDQVEEALCREKLVFSPTGIGGIYFLDNLFVIKPEDENLLSLNNPREFGSPFAGREHGPRTYIAGYESSQRDALCYEVAKLLGIENLTPKAVMGIVRSEQFYGEGDKEKLCSVQEYLTSTISLYDYIKEERDIALIDEEDFALANFFVWVIFDNDAHPRNFRLYQKGEVLGIHKIDNSLSFPEKNRNLTNFLPLLPQGQNRLSASVKQKIAQIPLSAIEEKMRYFELSEDAISACKARVFLLQALAEKDLSLSALEEQLIQFLNG